ncbi:SGNH/GDSL hydrolase family protein [Jatrophihabitans fulvus]
MSRAAFVATAAVVIAGCGGVAVLATQGGSASSRADGVTWSVPDRTTSAGVTATVRPDSWPVDLTACTGDGRVRWQITGTALTTPIDVTAGCRTRQSLPALDAYRVTATTDTGTRSADVELRDLLVVSVGDSVASGEGDPDSPAGSDDGLRWQDARCHRSALAGPAQAALRLERRDPHTSVTFVGLACSGATIDEGLIGPYRGIDADGTDAPLPPQLDAAVARAAGRPIDALLVSIGANDLGFGAIVRDCVLLPDCSRGRGAQRYAEGVQRAPAGFVRLDARLDELAGRGLLRHAFSTGYFDVATRDDGQLCPGPDDGRSQDGISRTEFGWTHEVVSPGLNDLVRDAVRRADGGADWHFVGGIAEAFDRHGYCAQDSWVRTASQSLRGQHDLTGSFHPNEKGQQLGYAVRIEAALAPLLTS